VRVDAGDVLTARRLEPRVQRARGLALRVVEDADPVVLRGELLVRGGEAYAGPRGRYLPATPTPA
jgi:hypothetical protein